MVANGAADTAAAEAAETSEAAEAADEEEEVEVVGVVEVEEEVVVVEEDSVVVARATDATAAAELSVAVMGERGGVDATAVSAASSVGGEATRAIRSCFSMDSIPLMTCPILAHSHLVQTRPICIR